MTESEMLHRLESHPELCEWALNLELIRQRGISEADGYRFTHKGHQWSRWLERQMLFLPPVAEVRTK